MPTPGLKRSPTRNPNSLSFQVSRKIAYNRKAEKSYSINDYPHNLVINYICELPFGPGKRFAKAGGAVGKVVGGWKIGGIQQYQSGGPNIIILGDVNSGYVNRLWPYEGTNGFMARPNVVPGVPQKSAALLSGHFDPNRDTMFNAAAFDAPALFTFGNSPRTFGGLAALPISTKMFP